MSADPEVVTKRRVILIECELPAHTWSSTELESFLAGVAPILGARVYGEVGRGEVNGCRQKLNQLTREIERLGEIPGDPGILHSAYKTGSFFRDCWPDTFYATVTT
jgi:hypothetical protein